MVNIATKRETNFAVTLTPCNLKKNTYITPALLSFLWRFFSLNARIKATSIFLEAACCGQ